MSKSMRSKRKKRLKAIRRDIVATELTVLKKEAAKLAAQEAALAAPKLIVMSPKLMVIKWYQAENSFVSNISEEKMENTYPNEELVENEQSRINHISKSTSLVIKIKNQKLLQLAMELNSEHVVDQSLGL
ncbi:hypothetical protein MTR67_007717 [Solanum verrucosum]|uniref:Uncharacterized protein n=1 Tax=Solanum verrucosum TaxID=315347 RepID=A0AAF0TB59_SOLVR|nr:hypothetical protein MTR67_007717 [Solanum verrucosum]